MQIQISPNAILIKVFVLFQIFLFSCKGNIPESIPQIVKKVDSSDSLLHVKSPEIPGIITTSISDSAIYISSPDILNHIKISYWLQDTLKSKLEIPGSDSTHSLFDLSNYTKFTYFNKRRHLDRNITNKNISAYSSSLANYIEVGSYLICLSEDFRRSKDILIWKKGLQNRYYLLNIFPNSIGVCLYCNPIFIDSKSDTIIIGGERNEEGSINGGYRYFIIKSDSLLLARENIIQGIAPWSGSDESNPIRGATCKKVIHIFYDDDGKESTVPFVYDCLDADKKIIYGEVKFDALELYQMYWNGVGKVVDTINIKNAKLKVGEKVVYGGRSYIALEYENKWYWTMNYNIKINVP